ncbi:MAG: hypothetical protein HDS26_03765 [Bacteroides sp.]|nr:hypothetical protein [Bacteroides sp.]
MAKHSGQTRTIRPSSNTKEANYANFEYDIKNSPDIDPEKSYFSHASGGFLLTMTGCQHDAAEYEAAKAMADDGLLVVLTPEGGVKFRTGKRPQGGFTYADGLVNGLSYEQQTKKPAKTDNDSLIKAVDQALKHAKEKQAQVPLIYDRYGSFHREHIEDGLKRFEERSRYRFKAILVVDKHGNVWEHGHNK